MLIDGAFMDTTYAVEKHQLLPAYRAQLFAALQQSDAMQEGWDKIFQLLHQGQRAARDAQLPEIAEQMGEGQSLVLQALRNSGKFLDWELRTLEVGLATGDIDTSYQRLQAHYSLLDQWRRQVFRRITLHVIIVNVIIVAAYIGLFYERLLPVTPGWLWMLGSVVGVTLVSVGLVKTLVQVVSGAASPGATERAGKIPAVASVLFADQLQHFFHSICQGVGEKGLPLTQALNLAFKKLPHRVGRSEFVEVYRQVQAGSRVSAALTSVGLLRGVPVGPMSMRGAGPQQAMEHLTEAVQSDYEEQLANLARASVQVPYLLLSVAAMIQWLVLLIG